MHEPEKEILAVRLRKLNSLRDKGIEPYPHNYFRSHTTLQAITFFIDHEKEMDETLPTEPITVAGRIIRHRGMGKATFIDIQDWHGKIQILLRQNDLGLEYDQIRDLDIGDFVGITGGLFRTKLGEITVRATSWTLLSKSLRPLPEKWHGLSDQELRYRQRYLDLITNDDARQVAKIRSNTISALRRIMESYDFMEVETPILVPVAAGGTARPFQTHHNSLNRDLYLRIATELYLKRLVVGGIEKVYEIGRVFRNEGIDFTHNPEFTMMESYEAYADYKDVMEMVEKIVSEIANQILGTTTIQFDGNEIDLQPPWPRRTLQDMVKNWTDIDFLEYPDSDSLMDAMRKKGFDVGQQMSWGGLLDKLISTAVEPNILQPTFLIDYPVEMSPLAKRKVDEPRLVERFEGFIAGMELCNAFTELNDPLDQRARLESQEALHNQFKDEDMDRLDQDFLIALEHGMPPTAGLGIGLDRLVMLLSDKKSIREVVLFPQLRST